MCTLFEWLQIQLLASSYNGFTLWREPITVFSSCNMLQVCRGTVTSLRSEFCDACRSDTNTRTGQLAAVSNVQRKSENGAESSPCVFINAQPLSRMIATL